jgi:hypothetical protein
VKLSDFFCQFCQIFGGKVAFKNGKGW